MEVFIDIFKVVIVSAMPVAELRVGLPLALMLGFSKRWAFFYAVLGNTLGLCLAFFILDYLMPWFKKVKIFRLIYLHSTKRVRRKRSRYLRLRYLALFLLVAVPMPGTGAWTAALVSHLFRFDRGKAMVVIFFGILAVAVVTLSVGVISLRGIQVN